MSQFIASVIIPSHNEESVIRNCLNSLMQQKNVSLEIHVISNGSTDNTVEIVKNEFPNVNIHNLKEASKIVALNYSDSVTTIFPRIYLDADITFNEDFALEQCLLTIKNGALATMPQINLCTKGSDFWVKSYTNIWKNTSYFNNYTLGLGVYILSEAARERFKNFPDTMAEDSWIAMQLKNDEKPITQTVSFNSIMPSNFKDHLKRITRFKIGNHQLNQLGPTPNLLYIHKKRTLRKFFFKQPLNTIIWSIFEISSKILAFKKIILNDFDWFQDESSR